MVSVTIRPSMPRSRINARARLTRFGYSSGGIGAIV